MDDISTLNEKAQRVYQYLYQLVRLRTAITSDVSDYIDTVWLNDIPKHSLCYCAAWEALHKEDDPVWVEIKRPRIPRIPPLPESCIPWIDLEYLDDVKKDPVLKDTIIDPTKSQDENGQFKYLVLTNFHDVRQDWERYLEQEWRIWAKETAVLRDVQGVYGRFFNMYQQQKALGESYEVVVGFGFLNLRIKDGLSVYRHILTAQVEFQFEPNNGTISLKISSGGAKLTFETEMLDPTQHPPVEILLNLEERLKDVDGHVWDNSVFQPILQSWVNSLSSSSVYEAILPPMERTAANHPIARFAPAVILRKRTNVGILKFLKEIVDSLQKTGQVPESIKVLLSIDGDSSGSALGSETTNGEKPSPAMPQEAYFPLPYNSEQFKIVQEVSHKRGVLVQGPPGTGKSHTIANLISHFLASGQRVLVTSQTARALKVLKDKIPSQVQPLCVSVLGQGQEDFNVLSGAVNDITGKYYSWDPIKNKERIKCLEDDLVKLREVHQKVTVSLRELREKEVYRHVIIDGKYTGTAQEIAQRLKDTEEHLGWLPDEITHETITPLTNDEFIRLVNTHRKFDNAKRIELSKKLLASSELFSPEEFVMMVEAEQKSLAKESELEKDMKLKLLYERLRKADPEKRKRLLAALSTLNKTKTEACRRPILWLGEAVNAMLGDQDQPLKDLVVVTEKYLKGLKDKALLADDCMVVMPQDASIYKLKADGEELFEFLKKGHSLGWGIFRPSIYKKVEYLLKAVQVNGKQCHSCDCLGTLINYLEVQIAINKLKEFWKEKIVLSASTLFGSVSFFEEQLEALREVINIEGVLLEAKKAVKDLEVISEPSWHDESEFNRISSVLESTLIIDQIRIASQRVDSIKVALKAAISFPDSHGMNGELLLALERRDWKRWGELYKFLLEIEVDRDLWQECEALLKCLKEKAPVLASAISENPNGEVLHGDISNLEHAWAWLRGDAWLSSFEETHDEYCLQRDYAEYEKKIKKVLAELVAEKAWGHCFSKMTEAQRANLVAWSHAIQKIGKGTGKRAEKHRKEAEGYMNSCRGAIPAWIMPIYRVVESLAPIPEIFDVVIVDEASQCGPEALFLLYIAKRCIVVGDDQQISPDNVGIERAEVDLLIERYLKGIPLKDTYSLESSLFTHAAIRYGSRIVLREHFRCVPEIIEFSNKLCYAPLNVPLIPLRSYPPKRLQPIRSVYVQGGYREGSQQKVVNKPEAERLVAQIIECCKDPAYKDKTMGVISLQGHTQSLIIERLLVEKIGPEEMERRELICGDAYDFQGDERDVIFLSMVAATNERIGPLTREPDKRRFNVAFSRAKDQIWLFHSVTVNDLSQADYRYKLLSYCLDPFQPYWANGQFDGVSLESLRRNQKEAPEPFESWFEIDVFSRIWGQGYKVVPQYRVADRRIDMVVEGASNRLAVECDGDAWHGPEQYENDQFRQRILERSGWKFWRIRGSSFYHDVDRALDPLWQVLEEMGIEKRDEILGVQPKSIEPSARDEGEQGILFQETVEDEAKDATEVSQHVLEVVKKTRGDTEKYQQLVVELLKEGSQGKDLIAEKVLRSAGIASRGRNRVKLRNKINRIVTDLRRSGLIEEYDTEARRRLKLPGNS